MSEKIRSFQEKSLGLETESPNTNHRKRMQRGKKILVLILGAYLHRTVVDNTVSVHHFDVLHEFFSVLISVSLYLL